MLKHAREAGLSRAVPRQTVLPGPHSILKIEEHVGDERKAGQQLAIGALSTIIYGLMKRHPDAWIGRLATIVLRARPIIDRREVQRARQAFLARHEST